MNKICFFLTSLLVLVLSGCRNLEMDTQAPEPSNPQKELQEVIITASIADATGETRTSYNEAEGKNYWSPGDKIKIFSAGESSEFTSINTVPETMVKFRGLISFITGTSNDDEDSKDYVWGLYPYSSSASYFEPDGISRTARITTKVPILQTGVAGTFGDNLAVMIGRSESLSIPFRGAYSGAFFQVSRSDIVSMTLRGLNGETLAGTATYKFNDSLLPKVAVVDDPKTSVTVVAPNGTFEPLKNYYIITLPDVALPDGYSVTLRRSDGYEGTYEVRANRPLNRIRFRNLSDPVDVRIENASNIANGTSTGWVQASSSVPLNEIHYTTTDGEAIQYNTTYLSFTGNEVDESGCVAPSDNGGVGIIRFTSAIAEIDDSAFEGATNLSSVSWPSTVVSIRDAAFSGCVNLEEVSFDNIEFIGIEAFKGCGFRYLVLPEGLQTVGQRPFIDCASLESVTLPQSLAAPTQMMFAHCPNLREFNGAFASDDHRCLIGNLTYQGKAVFAFAPAGLGPDDTYIVPEGVASISSYAFAGYDIGRVILPESLNTISTYAFYGCSSLKDVTIPANVDRIYVHAFENCTGLQWMKILRTSSVVESRAGRAVTNTNDCPIYVPSNLLDQYKTAQNWVYFADRFRSAQPSNEIWYTTNDGAHAEYTIPSGYSQYGAIINTPPSANLDNLGVGVLSFPIDLTEIPEFLFNLCENVTSVSIPEGVTFIGNKAFQNCISLAEVSIPSSLTGVGDNPFLGCRSLSFFNGYSDLISSDHRCIIQNGILASFAPAGLEGQHYSIPASVTEIGGISMQHGTFKYLYIPETVTTIGWGALAECPELLEVNMPKSVTSIMNYAFSGCVSLRQVGFDSSVPPTLYDDVFEDTNDTFQLVIPGAGATTYPNASDNWLALYDHIYYYQADDEIWYHYWDNQNSATLNIRQDFGANAESSMLLIADRTHVRQYPSYLGDSDGSVSIAVAKFSGPVTKVPAKAFTTAHLCNLIDWVSLPPTVTEIGDEAFRNCTRLLNFPVKYNYVLTSIGKNAFRDCSSMTYCSFNNHSIGVNSQVTSIGDRAFFGCTSMQSFDARGVTSLGRAAFSGCSGLEYASIGPVTEIKDSTFAKCNTLSGVVGAGSVTKVGEYAFFGCTALDGLGDTSNSSSLNLNSLTTIGQYAFYNCQSIEEAILPAITSLGFRCFGNTGLANVHFGSTLTNVPRELFFQKPDTRTLNLYFEGNTPPTFATEAFRKNETSFVLITITAIHVPSGRKDAYVTALTANNPSYTTFSDIISADL